MTVRAQAAAKAATRKSPQMARENPATTYRLFERDDKKSRRPGNGNSSPALSRFSEYLAETLLATWRVTAGGERLPQILIPNPIRIPIHNLIAQKNRNRITSRTRTGMRRQQGH